MKCEVFSLCPSTSCIQSTPCIQEGKSKSNSLKKDEKTVTGDNWFPTVKPIEWYQNTQFSVFGINRTICSWVFVSSTPACVKIRNIMYKIIPWTLFVLKIRERFARYREKNRVPFQKNGWSSSGTGKEKDGDHPFITVIAVSFLSKPLQAWLKYHEESRTIFGTMRKRHEFSTARRKRQMHSHTRSCWEFVTQ